MPEEENPRPIVSDDAEGGETASRGARWLTTAPLVPLPFLGLGVYRAWLNLLFDYDLAGRPAGMFVSQDVFDIVMVAALLVCVVLARHIASLYTTRWAAPCCLGLLIASTLWGFASWWFPAYGAVSLWACTVLGALGTALVILLWSEAYGRLSPVRICLYYSASLVVGAALGWVYDGIDATRLPVMACALPVASLVCLRSCYARGFITPVCPREWASFSFPWKPVLVVAVYSFSYGLMQSSVFGVSRSNESVGTIVCALVVALAIALIARRVDFGPIYGTALPFTSAVCLMLAAMCDWDDWTRNFFANCGYTASQIFIMVMIGSLCYRWGANAVWLFGIERAVRQLAMIGGRTVESAMGAVGLPITPLLVVIVMLATLVMLREGRLDSSWGLELSVSQREPDRSHTVEERHSLVRSCTEIARTRNLSQREGEVLLLLAQKKTARDIEQELCIANGTAKAHIRHVYQKLDIHTREELFAMVEQGRTR